MKDRIIFVEDNEDQQELGKRSLARLLPDAEIIICGTMDEVAKALRTPPQLGIITDNGFPMTEGGSRVGGQSLEGGAGLMLIKAVRAGQYGNDLKSIRIAFLSANLTMEKTLAAKKIGGPTLSIEKESDWSHIEKAVHYIQDIRRDEHKEPRGFV